MEILGVPMTALTRPFGMFANDHRSATDESAPLSRRILAWVSGEPRKGDEEKRSPLAKPFPFFGE
jgi:hypothetical protein